MFQTELKIHFYDCDPAGIMFYANIFKLADIALEGFLAKVSPERNLFLDKEIVLPVFHSEADYKRPLKAFDKIDCKAGIRDLRESSFQVEYSFYVNSELHAVASSVHVCVDKKTFQKTALPDDLKAKLAEELLK